MRLRLIWNFVVPRVNYLIVWFSRIRKGLDSPNPRYYQAGSFIRRSLLKKAPFRSVISDPLGPRPRVNLLYKGQLFCWQQTSKCWQFTEFFPIFRNFFIGNWDRYLNNSPTSDIRLNRWMYEKIYLDVQLVHCWVKTGSNQIRSGIDLNTDIFANNVRQL